MLICIRHARCTSFTLFNSDMRKLLESQGLAILFDNFVREDVRINLHIFRYQARIQGGGGGGGGVTGQTQLRDFRKGLN